MSPRSAQRTVTRAKAESSASSTELDRATADAVCRLARDLFAVPVAVVSAAARDVGDPPLTPEATWYARPREAMFLSRALATEHGLVVVDAEHDPRLRRAIVGEGGAALRFFAGVPVRIHGWNRVAVLWIADTRPRRLSRSRFERLRDLAGLLASPSSARSEIGPGSSHGFRSGVDCGAMPSPSSGEREHSPQAERHVQRMAEKAAGFGHWRIRVAARTIVWSDGIARIFGRRMPEGGEIGIEAHAGFYHPDDRGRVLRLMDDAASGRAFHDDESYAHSSRVIRPDGEVRCVSVRGLVERDGEGRVTSIYGVCLDVTESTRAEAHQREIGDLLRTTLEAMDQGILMLGPDERIRVHNQRARDLLGVPAELFAEGASFDAIRRYQCANGEFDRASPRLRAWMTEGGLERNTFTHERERPDGTILEVRAVPLADGGVVRTFSDVTERRANERAVKISERRYRLLAENTTDVIILSDLDTRRRYVSPAVKTMLGYDAEDLIGTRPIDSVHPDDVEGYGRVLADLVEGRVERCISSQRYRHRDGRWIWIEVSFTVTHDPKTGIGNGYVASLRDITDRKAVEEDLRVSEERLSLALDSGSDGLWDWNVSTGAIEFSGNYYRTLGYGLGEIETHVQHWSMLAHPDDAERVGGRLRDHLKGITALYECEYRIRAKAGDYRWVLARGKVVARDGAGRATRAVGTFIDITRRKAAEHQIEHMALHDALTGLPNRTLFRDRLNHELARTDRHGGAFAVLTLDLDRFKAINDTLGHPAGDALLRTVAARLRSVVRDGDTVARLGGDEFAMIVGRLDQPGDAHLTAQRAIDVLGLPVDLDGHAVSVGATIGIAIGPGDGCDPDELFKHADLALYRGKAAGRNTYRFYEPGMDALVATRNLLELDMRDAIVRGDFTLHYQPVVDLKRGRIAGFEALMRWDHPVRGTISPGEFIPLAEETGLIVPLGTWVLNEACRQATTWPGALRVAVNVSPVQFHGAGLEQAVLAALRDTGLPPDRLELEITESVLLQDGDGVIACLHRLRTLGVRVALDDFGTGYSSLSYLRRFPFDKIKIDRSFIREIGDPDTAAIVQAIIGIGERLGTSITAEGVETQAQLDRVTEEGCTEVQGYFFGRPTPVLDLPALILRLGATAASDADRPAVDRSATGGTGRRRAPCMRREA